MVNSTAQSLLAEFADADVHDSDLSTSTRTAGRFASVKREQPSRTRQATEARHRRKRNAKLMAPLGPRRRFRKG